MTLSPTDQEKRRTTSAFSKVNSAFATKDTQK
jgi:hypothetical protein